MWQLDNNQGRLVGPTVSALIDVRNPAAGIHQLTALGHQEPSISLLQVRSIADDPSEVKLVDCYVRGHDLVATYEDSSPRKLRSQIYWHVDPKDDLPLGIETIISAQTSTLGADPGFQSTTSLRADYASILMDANEGRFRAVSFSTDTIDYECQADLILFRLTIEELSLAVMIYPSDFLSATLRRDASQPELLSFSYALFGGEIEKGVIRRGRVKAVFIPRENDEATALAAYRAFASSRPPLTT